MHPLPFHKTNSALANGFLERTAAYVATLGDGADSFLADKLSEMRRAVSPSDGTAFDLAMVILAFEGWRDVLAGRRAA